MEQLHGLGVALATPFDKNEKIDYTGLLKLLIHTATNGVDYWVVMGSTGEAITLSDAEQMEVLAFITENNPKKLPIILGLGGSNTNALTQRIQNIDLSNVIAILSSSPAYNKPSQEGIVQHFTALADASPKPIILYNVPGRTASNMEAPTTIKLAQHSNIIGIKEASGDLLQIMKIINGTSSDFLVTSGDDLLTPAICSIGGNGLISVLGNALPKEMKALVKTGLEGDINNCRKQAFALLGINELMYKEGNPTGIKELLSQLDICNNNVRLPLVSASNNLSTEIEKYLN